MNKYSKEHRDFERNKGQECRNAVGGDNIDGLEIFFGFDSCPEAKPIERDTEDRQRQ